MSNSSRITFLLIALLAMVYVSEGQNANLILEEEVYGRTHLSLNGNYDIGSNAITSAFIGKYYNGQYLSSDIKEKTFRKLKNNNRLGLDISYNLSLYQLPDTADAKKKWGYYFEWNNAIHADISFTEDLFRLYFSGNKAYAGKNAQLASTKFNLLSYRQLKGGVLKTTTNSLIGFGVSFIKGDEFVSSNISEGSLFTEENGNYIDIDTKLEFRQRDQRKGNFFDGKGWGSTFDFYYKTKVSDKSVLSAEIRDFGFIAWNGHGKLTTVDTALTFEGVEVDDLLNFGDSLFSGYTSDALEDSIGAKTKVGPFTSLFPGYLGLNFISSIKSNLKLIARANYRLNAGYFPYLYFGTTVEINKALDMVSGLSYGGYAGLGLNFGVRVSMGEHINIALSTNHLEGYVLRNSATAQGLYLNIKSTF